MQQTPPDLPAEDTAPQNQPPARPSSLLKKWPILIEVALLAAITLAIGGWAIPRLAARFASSPPVSTIAISGTPYDCGNPPASSAPIGAAAIQPHLPGVPSFTEEDVRQFVTAHPFSGHRFQSQGPVTFKRILFTTSYDACQLMKGEYIGLPNDAIVCYVEVSGTFVLIPPPGVTSPPTPLHTGEEVFDGKTGNLLVIGVR